MRQLTDPGSELTASRAYEPFGSLLSSQGQAASSYGFAGEWEDATGLIHLRARYYSPEMGRFFQQDPFDGIVKQPSTLNAYSYALNNPILLTDPSGKAVCPYGRNPITNECLPKPDLWPDWLTGLEDLLPAPLCTWLYSPGFGADASMKLIVTASLICGGLIASQLVRDVDVLPRPRILDYPGMNLPWDASSWPALYLRPQPVPNSPPEHETTTPSPVPLPIPTETSNPKSIIEAYRELGGKLSGDKTHYRKPLTSPSEFRLDPDGVSIFELGYLLGIKPYIIGFDIRVHEPVLAGSVYPIIGLACNATYTPNIVPGHWSINCTPRSNTSQILAEYTKNQGTGKIALNPQWTGIQDRRIP